MHNIEAQASVKSAERCIESNTSHKPPRTMALATGKTSDSSVDSDAYVEVVATTLAEVKQAAAEAGSTRLSSVDIAAGIALKQNDLTATGRLGYRMVRGTTGCHLGHNYFEVKIEHLGSTGAVRLGTGTQWVGSVRPHLHISHSMYAARCLLWRVQMTKLYTCTPPHPSLCFSLFKSPVSSRIGSRALQNNSSFYRSTSYGCV